MPFLLTVESAAQIRVYPEGSRTEHNDDYTVCVRRAGSNDAWSDLFEYKVDVDMDNVQTASMVQFDMGSPVEVRIRKNNGDLLRTDVRPLSKQVAFKQEKNSVTLTLQKPQYLSVEFNGDRLHNLHLFANPLETETYNGTEQGVTAWSSNDDNFFKKDLKVIYFGPGVHKPKDLPNNSIRIPSNTTVYLAAGALVQAKLVVDKSENVRIIGRGIIDHASRGVEVTNSKNVLIDGITVLNPDHYSVFGGGSTGLTVKNLKSFSCKGWSDGIDLMSCSDVLIDNVFMRNSDDCIALYGHRWDYWGNSRNVVVQNATLWADIAHPINIGGHGNYQSQGDTLENYVFRNIDILEHDEDDDPYQGCMAIGCGDKNLVRNVLFENIRVEDFQEGRLFHLSVNFNEKYNKAPGRGIEGIVFRNIVYNGTDARQSLIKGYDAQNAIKKITFENVMINKEKMKDTKDFIVNEFVSGIKVK